VLILLACLSWLAWRVAQVVELRKWRRANDDAAHATSESGTMPSKNLTGALIDPGISLGLFFGVPLALGTPLSTLKWFAPDVTHWLILNAIVAIVIMFQRLVLWTSRTSDGA
jgi:hypothetical protein